MSKQSWAESELSLMASAVTFGGRTERRTEAKRIRITIVLRTVLQERQKDNLLKRWGEV